MTKRMCATSERLALPLNRRVSSASCIVVSQYRWNAYYLSYSNGFSFADWTPNEHRHAALYTHAVRCVADSHIVLMLSNRMPTVCVSESDKHKRTLLSCAVCLYYLYGHMFNARRVCTCSNGKLLSIVFVQRSVSTENIQFQSNKCK